MPLLMACNSRFVPHGSPGGFLWLAILLVLVIGDYYSRAWFSGGSWTQARARGYIVGEL